MNIGILLYKYVYLEIVRFNIYVYIVFLDLFYIILYFIVLVQFYILLLKNVI